MFELDDIYLTYNIDSDDECVYQYVGKILVDKYNYFIGVLKNSANMLRNNYKLVLGKKDNNSFYMIKMFNDNQAVEEYSFEKIDDTNKYIGMLSLISSECSAPVCDVKLVVFDENSYYNITEDDMANIKGEIEDCIRNLGDDSLFQYTKYHLNKYDTLDKEYGKIKIITK